MIERILDSWIWLAVIAFALLWALISSDKRSHFQKQLEWLKLSGLYEIESPTNRLCIRTFKVFHCSDGSKVIYAQYDLTGIEVITYGPDGVFESSEFKPYKVGFRDIEGTSIDDDGIDR